LIDPEAIARTIQLLSAERYSEVLTLYFEQAEATVEQMRHAVRDAQPLALGTHAHATRGAALNLGLPALAAVAKALQDGAAHLPAHEVARLVQQFAELIPATREAARAAALLPGTARLAG
ncbi:MAG: Hpt domain-containing protein, partial [Rubrivivax sp.]|nr:Hpt domain-containing protein [Rubrivivax sp.]